MKPIDIKALAARESEQVEWKENVADCDDVVETCTAFANDYQNLGGGYVVCGAREERDEHGFPKVSRIGLTASRLKEIENRVLDTCRRRVDPPIAPLVEELPSDTDDRRVLVFIVPKSPHAHSFRRKDHAPKYYIRVSRSTIEARNGLYRELLVRKGAMEPWDDRVPSNTGLEDIDTFTFRETMARMSLWDPNKPLEDYFDPDAPLAALAPSLAVREPLTGKLRPKNFVLLLFGRHVQQRFQGAYAVLSIYPGVDRGEPHAERTEITGTLLEQARRLLDALGMHSYGIIDKTAAAPNLLKYPQRALQEAVVNALVHRDYEINQPVRVTVFADRVEIRSPGALPTAVDKDKFLKGRASPVWRNQALAYFFNKMQLAQAEGQGIPTIFRTMQEEGCPPPVFELEPESVTCILPAHPRYAIMRELREVEGKISIGKYADAAETIDALLARDPHNSRALELLCEVSALLEQPQRVYDFMQSHRIDPSLLSPSVQLRIAEIFIEMRSADEDIEELARKLLRNAARGRLEETQARHLVVSLRKLGSDPEAIIGHIDRFFEREPSLRSSFSLLQLRGRALIDLAKLCTSTARNRNASAQVKARAWEECRAYLTEAERDLQGARELSSSPWEREHIEQDLEFLRRLQEISKKPKKTRSQRGKRRSGKSSTKDD